MAFVYIAIDLCESNGIWMGKNTQIEYRFLLIAIEPHSMALCVVVWLSLTGNKVILFDINLQFPR